MASRSGLFALILLAGCTSTPAAPAPPPGAEDQARLRERLREALESPYVLGRYYAEYEVGGKVLTRCRGTARGFRSGVVLIEEETESGAPLRLLRVADRAWMFQDGWREAVGTAWESVGSGFQSPYEVLEALEKAAEAFTPHRQGGIDCPSGRALLRPLAERAGAHPAAEQPVEGVLKSGFKDGPLVTRFSAGQGAWIAKMDVVSWGPAPPMRFDDIPAPFTPDMKAAVRKALQEEVR